MKDKKDYLLVGSAIALVYLYWRLKQWKNYSKHLYDTCDKQIIINTPNNI